MKILKYMVMTAIAVAGLASQSNADLIDLGLIVDQPPPLGSPQDEADFLEDRFNLNFELQLVDDIAFTGDGPLSFNVAWNLPLTDPGLQLDYVFAKDGQGTVGLESGILYHLYEVSFDQRFVGSGTVTIDGSKEISNIRLFGHGAVPGVPDGGTTLMLLGSALAGLAALRRRFA
jgi:hypothetical protein